MKIEVILDELGLGKTKGQVYVAMLETGTGTVQDIAKRAGLPRTTVHEILQHLLQLGLVHLTTRGRTRIYTAEPPKKLKNLLREKENKLDAILPELTSLLNIGSARPHMRFYEGVTGVKTVLEDTLTIVDKNKTLLGILSMEDLYQIPGKEFMDRYVRDRITAGIKLKVIRSAQKEVAETWPSSVAEQRELRYAPNNLLFPMTMYLYDNKVAIIGTKKENFGMIIESADLFVTMKNFFGVMWELGRAGKRK